ncbi:Prenyltransferase, UbiA family [Nitrosotalea sinensis]|uniref:Prenyltransferase, UbiA family n=1 Tax=Nitrosotalea sinensis TaxID=1499975 RepID=A0A2H1EJC7_9ARCH|nr:UbiA family prenyltransferase [Candidatus Nitrosotalea sinensis]SHO47711.1 Prenyltransferase, UbiA family [Candidatus Nitrosotalea sinensis]
MIKSRTIVYGFALASLGTFLISSGMQIPDFFTLSKLTLSVYFLALATYLYNDLTDYDVDEVNDRNTMSSKKTYRNQIMYATTGFFVFSTSMAFWINMQTGIAALVFLGLAIAYSHPKIHLKNMFVIKTIVTALGGFIASMMGAFATQNISYFALASSTIVFLIYFINGPLNDIRDLEGDKKGGRRTIPIVIGVKKSFMVVIGSILSIAMLILAGHYFLGMHMIGAILGLMVCGYLVMKIGKLTRNYSDKKSMNKTRTSVRNSIFTIQGSILVGLILSQMFIPNF